MDILLDQKDFIGLAKADIRSKRADPVYVAILEVVRELKSQGHRFPLCISRYYEVATIRSARQRMDLAMIMQELSDFQTLICPTVAFRAEVTNAFAEIADSVRPWSFTPIGYGHAHAFGIKGFTVSGPDGPAPDSIQMVAQVLMRERGRSLEFQTLACERLDKDEARHDDLLRTAREHGEKFERRENAADARARSLCGDDCDIVEIARLITMTDFAKDLVEVVVSDEDIRDHQLGDQIENDGDLRFVHEVPGLDVLAELRAVKWRNAEQSWTRNDWYDVTMLRHGVPYCDLVSTDKDWADKVRQTSLCDRYNTIVTGKPSDLLAELGRIA